MKGSLVLLHTFFLLEILVLRKFKNPIQKIISLKACLSYFFLYPMNVMRDAIEF